MQNTLVNKSSRRGDRSFWHQGLSAEWEDVSLPDYLAYCGVAAALRHYIGAKRLNLAVLEIAVPDAIDSYMRACRLFMRRHSKRSDYRDPYIQAVKRRNDKLSEYDILRKAAEDGKGVLFCTSLAEVDEELKLFADLVYTIPPPTLRQISAIFRRFGHNLSSEERDMVATESWTRLTYAFQPGRPVSAALRRLRETAKRLQKPNIDRHSDTPALEDLSGLGPAAEWGLELACDIADFKAGLIKWDDVDTGVLVSGPPGTGKTMFARALARTCGIPIVAVSAAQWQASGYLNDMLKSMRTSFMTAQSQGPAILFIDEVDAVGSRENNNSHNAEYIRQVIDGLLELLDGYERRSGVIVVAATNHPAHLDRALLRPGRLDKHFVISLPDEHARHKIFSFHSGLSVPTKHEARFNRSTEGMSGAAIEQLVRDARRVSRRRREVFEFQHVLDVSRHLVRLPIEHMRRTAYHEAGHALVGILVGMDLQSISINDMVFPEGVNYMGGAAFVTQPFAMMNRDYYRGQLAMYLSGIAAENVILGDFTYAISDAEGSDLAIATALATRIEASLGMGRTLVVDAVSERDLARLRAESLELTTAVAWLLDEEFFRARSILEKRIDVLHEVAQALLDKRVVSGAEVRKMLECERPLSQDPLGYDVDNPDDVRRIAHDALSRKHQDEVRREVDAAMIRWRMRPKPT